MFGSLGVRRGREGLEVGPQLVQLKTMQGGVMALRPRHAPLGTDPGGPRGPGAACDRDVE